MIRVSQWAWTSTGLIISRAIGKKEEEMVFKGFKGFIPIFEIKDDKKCAYLSQ